MTDKNYDISKQTGNNALDAMLKSRSQPKNNELYNEEINFNNSYEDEISKNISIEHGNVYNRDNENIFYDGFEQDDILRDVYNFEDDKVEKVKDINNNFSSKKSSNNGLKIAGITICSILVLSVAGITGYTYLYPNIHYGIKAGTILVGGKTEQEAKQIIDKATNSILDKAKLNIKIYNKDYEINIPDVAHGLDSKNSAQEAYNYTRTGGYFERVKNTMLGLFGMSEAKLSVNVNQDALKLKLDEIAAQAIREPIEPSWTVEGNNLVIDKGYEGVSYNTDELLQKVEDRIKTMDFSILDVDVQTKSQQPIDIDKISNESQTTARNATVDKKDGKTIIPSVDGVKFDLEKAREIVGDGSKQTYTIPIERTAAKVTADELSKVLFRDVLASTSTKLNSGNKPRTNNVKLASSFMNGTILNPGDEFSYNGVVGERRVDRGFQTAGAYAAGKVIEDVGGGVCQPSSTLYMAVLRADLEVVERHNHSLTVAYTPLGEDATVSWGGPDFRFKNNTDYPIKIIAWQEGGAMGIDILGTKTTDKVVKTKTDVVETINYGTVEKTDASMPEGKKQTTQNGENGYRTVTYKIITENGQTKTVKANNSHYQKRDKIVSVGTKKVEPQPPAENQQEGSSSAVKNPEESANSTTTEQTTTTENNKPSKPQKEQTANKDPES